MQSPPRRRANWHLDPKSTAGIGVALLLVVLVGYTSRLIVAQVDAAFRSLAETHHMLAVLEDARQAVLDADADLDEAQRTGDAAGLMAAGDAVRASHEAVARARALIADDPPKQQRLDALDAELARREELVRHVAEIRDTERLKAALARLRKGGDRQAVKALLLRMRDDELALLRERSEQSTAAAARLTLVTSAASLLAVLGIAGAALLVNRAVGRRRAAEDALRCREEGYRLLFERASDAIVVIDPRGGFCDVNARAETLTGYTRTELLRLDLPALARGPDADRVRAMVHELEHSGGGVGEYTMVRQDGTEVRVEAAAGVLSAGRHHVILHDVSRRWREADALKQSQADLTVALEAEAQARRASDAARQAVIEAAPVAIVTLDLDRRVGLWNPAAERLFGWSAREIVGQPYPLAPPGKEAEYESHFRRLLRGESLLEVESQRRGKDGTLIDVSIEAVPLRATDGRIDGVLVVLTDLSERRRLEEQVRQAQKMEAVGRLAGGIAHDFNNLLTIILGYADLALLALSKRGPEAEQIEQIRRAGERASSLTQQLLAFSRKQVIQPEVLDVNAVVTDAEKMLRRLVGEDIKVALALARGIGRVRADAGQLHQVLDNLAVNARDAMPRGGRLTIETQSVELDAAYTQMHFAVKPGRYILLAVSDTGTGMDEAVRKRLFEPFFTTKGPGRGTGLGLATVFGIVKQGGGNIGVYSEPGEGTTFKIYLPVVEAEAEAPGPAAAPSPPPRGRETILVAEDEPGVRVFIADVLNNLGYAVLLAANGADAVRVAHAHTGSIHLLLTDVVMPELSGRELAESLQAHRPGLRVLFMSGYTDDAVVRHGVLQAEVAFLQKPFRADDLARKVRDVLGRSRESRLV
jgi:PAS domain S-box-containing protein